MTLQYSIRNKSSIAYWKGGGRGRGRTRGDDVREKITAVLVISIELIDFYFYITVST